MLAVVSIINVYIESGMHGAFLGESAEISSTVFNLVNVLGILL